MAIMVNGNLSVQRIKGQHGEFSVGKLDCEIGVLNIKDPHLDQYETGTYAGRFGITRVYSHGYSARTGFFVVEIRALIDEYIILDDKPGVLDKDIALTESDPLDTLPSSSVPEKPKATQTPIPQRQSLKPAATAAPLDRKAAVPSHVEDAALFGELWPLAQEVKLDPTSMRSEPEKHRQRCKYLKDKGYLFKAASQTWNKTT